MKRILTALAALVLLTSAATATIPVVPYPTSVQEQKGPGFNAKGAAVRCEGALDALCARKGGGEDLLRTLLAFELGVLRLSGLYPEMEAESGCFSLRGERSLPVSAEVALCLRRPLAEKNFQILVDAARAIGVFYAFHLDSAPETRRTVLRMISNNE